MATYGVGSTSLLKGGQVSTSASMKDVVKTAGPGISEAASVTFNNQSMVLMRYDLAKEDNAFVLLHGNRLYRFSKDPEHIPGNFLDIEGGGTGQNPEDLAQNLLLRFQTTPKYRARNTMYFTFRMLDNMIFMAIIVLTILNGKITCPSAEQISVLSAIGFETFYDIMLYTTRFWILTRLSVFIGLEFYVVYAAILWWNHPEQYVWFVLLARFVAFVFEECIDIAIDIEMHNDLIMVCGSKDPGPFNYMDVRRSLQDFEPLPAAGFYEGSGSAWLPKSVSNRATYKREVVPTLRFRWLYALPAMPAFLLVLVLCLMIAIALFPVAVVLSIAPCLKCIREGRCSFADVWDEVRHF